MRYVTNKEVQELIERIKVLEVEVKKLQVNKYVAPAEIKNTS